MTLLITHIRAAYIQAEFEPIRKRLAAELTHEVAVVCFGDGIDAEYPGRVVIADLATKLEPNPNHLYYLFVCLLYIFYYYYYYYYFYYF